MEDKKLYTMDEVVKLTGLSKHTILKAIKNGILVPKGLNKRPYRFGKKDVEFFCDTCSKVKAEADITELKLRIKKNKLLQQKFICDIRIARKRKDTVKEYEYTKKLIDLRIEALSFGSWYNKDE